MVVTRAQVEAEVGDEPSTTIDSQLPARIQVEPEEAESAAPSTIQKGDVKSQADRNNQTGKNELELEYSTYDNSLLEEKYHALLEDHHLLQKHATHYRYALWSRTRHDLDVDIRPLHDETGDDGLRGKLSMLDDFMPFIDDAGNADALKANLRHLEDLKEAAGGEDRLGQVVEDAQFLRDIIEKAGGLHNLSNIVINSNDVRSKQEELQLLEELRNKAGGHDELLTVMETAQLLRDFIEEAGGLYNFINMLRDYKLLRLPLEDLQILEELVGEFGGITKLEELVANAEAIRTVTDNAVGQPCLQLLSTIVKDYNFLRLEQKDCIALRELVYGPAGWKAKAQWYDWFKEVITSSGSDMQPPVLASSARKLSSLTSPPNDAYSGRFRASTPSQPVTLTPNGIHPARAQLLATTPRSNDPLRDLYNPPATPKRKSTGSNQEPLGKPGDARSELKGEQARIKKKRGNDGQLQPHPMLIKRIREDMQPPILSPMSPPVPATMTQEPGLSAPSASMCVSGPPILVQRLPIAFWIGPGHAGVYETPRLLSHAQMPSRVARTLATELGRFLNLSNSRITDMWPPHENLCILQYASGEQNAFGHGEERRACKNCAVASPTRGPRPCALLQRVNRELTVIFLPLPESLRPGLTYRDRASWVASTK